MQSSLLAFQGSVTVMYPATFSPRLLVFLLRRGTRRERAGRASVSAAGSRNLQLRALGFCFFGGKKNPQEPYWNMGEKAESGSAWRCVMEAGSECAECRVGREAQLRPGGRSVLHQLVLGSDRSSSAGEGAPPALSAQRSASDGRANRSS